MSEHQLPFQHVCSMLGKRCSDCRGMINLCSECNKTRLSHNCTCHLLPYLQKIQLPSAASSVHHILPHSLLN